MADRIRDLEQLHYVYTQDERTCGKEEMFARYYSKAPNPPSQPSDGYVKAEIQVIFRQKSKDIFMVISFSFYLMVTENIEEKMFLIFEMT